MIGRGIMTRIKAIVKPAGKFQVKIQTVKTALGYLEIIKSLGPTRNIPWKLLEITMVFRITESYGKKYGVPDHKYMCHRIEK